MKSKPDQVGDFIKKELGFLNPEEERAFRNQLKTSQHTELAIEGIFRERSMQEGEKYDKDELERLIQRLKDKLNESTEREPASTEENSHNEKEDFSSFLLKLKGVEDISDIRELCKDDSFIQEIERFVKEHEEHEIVKGNKRSIDKYFFDRLNAIFDLKKGVFNWLENDPTTKPKVLELELGKTLAPISSDDHFTWDDNKTAELENLKKEYPHITIDDIIPNNIKYVIYKACKRYPELIGQKISFVGVDGFKIMPKKQHVMRSQIKPRGVFKELLGADPDREYVIQINLLDKDGVAVLDKLSQDAKGGVMVHELAHSLDYHLKIASKVAKFLVGFAASPKRVRDMERKTDETAIARGLGYHLYKFRQEVHHLSSAEYVNYKKRTYLIPEEILYLILKHHNAYDNNTLKKVLEHIENKEF